MSLHADVAAKTDASAAAHHETVARSDSLVTRGKQFLCAGPAQDEALSCQILSPYGDAYPLVIYCDATACEMPAMALDSRIVVSARWSHDTAAFASFGQDIVDRVQRLYEFLLEQS